MKNSGVFIFYFVCFTTYAQNYLTNIIDKPYNTLYRSEDHLLYSTGDKKKSIFYDGKAIDSTFARLDFAFLKNETWVCFTRKNDLPNRIILITIGGKISSVKTPDLPNTSNIYKTVSNIYITGKYNFDSINKYQKEKFISQEEYDSKKENPFDKKLYQLNPYTGQIEKLLFDLDVLFKDSIDYLFDIDNIRGVYKLSESNLLITTCFDQVGGWEHINYFIFDIKINSIKRIKNIYKRDYDKEVNGLIMYYSDLNQKYHLGEYFSYGVRNEDQKGYFIFDKNINVITKILYRTSSNIGFNYIKGKIDSYNVKSRLDDNKVVIVPYKLILPLERSLYKSYNDQEILGEDLSLLDKYAIDILRNHIYAKHNYKFTDIFYQAYFNLFDFYGDSKKKSSRLTNVNNLFTPTDKKNLQLIDIALGKLNK